LKPAVLRPQALRDQQGEVRYYRKEGGTRVAVKVADSDISYSVAGSSDLGTIIAEPDPPTSKTNFKYTLYRQQRVFFFSSAGVLQSVRTQGGTLLEQYTYGGSNARQPTKVTVFNPKAPGVLSNARPMRITAPSADAVAFQINPGHTGATRFADANLPAASLWSVDLGGTPSYALLADGKVFVTVSMQGDNSQVVALDQATGAVVWGPQPIAGQAGAAYQGGSVFVVGSIFGQPALLQAFDATTGLTQWRTLLAGQWVFTAPPTAANGKVYVAGAGGGGTLYAVSQGTGQLAWTQRVSGGEGTAPAVSADGVFVTPACNAFALQAATGAPLWSDIGCSGAGGAIPVLANGVLYAPYGRANYDGSTFNAVTGSRLGAYAADNPPAIGSDAGYFLQGGTLRGVGLAGNTALWSFAGDGTLVTSPIIVNDWVFVGGSSGNLYALDAQTGRLLWEQDLGAPLPAGAGWNARLPISGMMAGNGLLVVPVGNRLTAYRLSSSP
jgi:outer membrane protein assembly factor BamB